MGDDLNLPHPEDPKFTKGTFEEERFIYILSVAMRAGDMLYNEEHPSAVLNYLADAMENLGSLYETHDGHTEEEARLDLSFAAQHVQEVYGGLEKHLDEED